MKLQFSVGKDKGTIESFLRKSGKCFQTVVVLKVTIILTVESSFDPRLALKKVTVQQVLNNKNRFYV